MQSTPPRPRPVTVGPSERRNCLTELSAKQPWSRNQQRQRRDQPAIPRLPGRPLPHVHLFLRLVVVLLCFSGNPPRPLACDRAPRATCHDISSADVVHTEVPAMVASQKPSAKSGAFPRFSPSRATTTKRKEHTQDPSRAHQRKAGRRALKGSSCTHQPVTVRPFETILIVL